MTTFEQLSAALERAKRYDEVGMEEVTKPNAMLVYVSLEGHIYLYPNATWAFIPTPKETQG